MTYAATFNFLDTLALSADAAVAIGTLTSDDLTHPLTIVRDTCQGVGKDVTVVKVVP